jgi:LysM repeat protein
MSKPEIIARIMRALCAILLVIAVASAASAQISEYNEPSEAPPSSVVAPPDQGTTPSAESPSAVDHLSNRPASAQPSVHSGGSFVYTVRPGDSLGSIASTFGVPVDQLAAVNHLDSDAVLYVGKTLRIPNPFAAQLRALQTQVNELQANSTAATQKVEAMRSRNRALKAELQSLRDRNDELQYSVKILPWWHGVAVTATIGAILMLGVTLVTLFQWWILRRRFAALAELCESLSRLDHKYKELLAKAELRFQQLYGRRRAGGEMLDHGKTQEEVEIERLGLELRDLLESYLRRLGLSRSRRRSGVHDLLGEVEPPIEARTARR